MRKRGDLPREIISSVKTLKTPLAAISQGECSGLPVTLWSNLSTEAAHVSRGLYSTEQSHGRKPVVRGLQCDRFNPLDFFGGECELFRL